MSELRFDSHVLFCEQCRVSAENQGKIWLFQPGFRPSGFPPERRAHLAAIEPRHFWFEGRSRLLRALLERFVAGGENAIELGCGQGAFLARLAHCFETVVGLDAYAESLTVACSRAPGAILIQGDASKVPLQKGQFDLVVALDVLEHMRAGELLDEARRLLRPSGLLLLSVPASASLKSRADDEMGHRTRFGTAQLATELEAAGLRLVHHTHYQFLLYPAVWLTRRLGFARLQHVERRPGKLLSAMFNYINHFEVSCFEQQSLPWGSSLIAIAAPL